MNTKFNYKIASTEKEVVEYFKTDKNTIMAYDTESIGLEYGCHVLGYSFYNTETEGLFIPTNNYFDGFSRSIIVKLLDENFTQNAIAHNAKYDETVLFSQGIKIPKLIGDTIVMIHNYNPDLLKNLETRVKDDFGWNKPTFKEVMGKNWDKIDWTTEKVLDVLAEYSCGDTYATYLLYVKYKALLEKENLTRVHDKIELPLIPVLRDMFIRGITVDAKKLLDIDKRLDGYLKQTEQAIYDEAKCVFNLNSPKQKAEILFDKLKLPIYKYTKKGGRATDSDTFEYLSSCGYPIGGHLNVYSTMGKLSSGYTKAIPRMLYPDSKLRCSFNSCGTATGRFSSSDPNLQNQPNNKDFPVRSSFVPSKGYGFFVADYSQIELRVMAHVSNDAKFKEAFNSGLDIHQKVADDLGISRSQAKTVNFGVLYGLGPAKLSATLGLSEAKAKKIINDYGETYTGYYSWKKKTEEYASNYGKVFNIFGRVRRLPHALSDDKKLHYQALRQAVNTVIQGSSADLIKLVMVKLYKTLKPYDSHILLQVHDELVVEYPLNRNSEEIKNIIRDVMANTVKLNVPLDVDIKQCSSWDEMKGAKSPITPTPQIDYSFLYF